MKGKRVLLVLFLISCSFYPLLAQDNTNPEDQPAVNKRSAVNFFGGVLLEPSGVNHKFGFSMGAHAGLTVLDHFYIGGYYLSLVSQIYRTDVPDHISTKLRGSLNHGGITLGYIWKPQSLINLNFNGKAGWGRIWYFDDKESNTDILEELYRSTRDNIFVLDPCIEVTVTPINWVRVGIGLGYRFVFLLDRYSASDYNYPVGSITISFGSFRGNADVTPGPNSDL